MSLAETVVSRFPEPIRSIALKHRELVKFALVGGTCFIIDTVLFFTIKTVVLPAHPVTAKIIATLVATIVSYILNREWSFRTRGGRERHHEAALFFLVNGVGIVLNSAPLYIARYGFHLQEPHVSRFAEEVSDFVSAQIVGTLVAMAFRWYGYKKWVFPEENVRGAAAVRPIDEEEALGHS